mmetsp:Transcript_78673/g.222998  ORF Transcript_78673/g.222998 Transcript_78673/m.222998 type:complete len:218 (-) Transcript_78673:31-684(-)
MGRGCGGHRGGDQALRQPGAGARVRARGRRRLKVASARAPEEALAVVSVQPEAAGVGVAGQRRLLQLIDGAAAVAAPGGVTHSRTVEPGLGGRRGGGDSGGRRGDMAVLDHRAGLRVGGVGQDVADAAGARAPEVVHAVVAMNYPAGRICATGGERRAEVGGRSAVQLPRVVANHGALRVVAPREHRQHQQPEPRAQPRPLSWQPPPHVGPLAPRRR